MSDFVQSGVRDGTSPLVLLPSGVSPDFVTRPFSTRAVTAPARGPHLRPGGPHPSCASHLRGHSRAYPRPVRVGRHTCAAEGAGASPAAHAAPLDRMSHVLSQPSGAGAHRDRTARDA